MRRSIRLLLAVVIGLAVGGLLAILIVADGALHVPERIQPRLEAAASVAGETGAAWRDVQVTAADGVVLDGWLFTPPTPNDALVLLLHGVADTRMGMLGHAAFLLRSGFAVLLPDSRSHGASGGNLITYGVKEADDVRRWTDWAFREQRMRRLYGAGASMGASILLESLPKEPRFRAVVAECPFATFEEVSYARLRQISGLPRAPLWPVVKLGFLYTRLRYRVDLRQASPANALRSTNIPVLLIHGTADENIPFRHSQELHDANPAATKLWAVEGAGHVEALSRNPDAYRRAVVDWFDFHR